MKNRFNSNYTAIDYLWFVLMLIVRVVVTMLRNSFLSILRSLRCTKSKRSRVVGKAERSANTFNDAGEATGKPAAL